MDTMSHQCSERQALAEFSHDEAGLHGYFEFWPEDAIASDANNDDYLDEEDLQ
jgi:hypothetical protein